jgi:DNA-binding GntR family transcriptional regulator
MIMTGKLKEGDKVNEGKLCETMGISKTPMREALRVLSVEGLIRLVPNRGAFVTKPEFEEIAEMFDVMSLLEGFCARRACEKMTPKHFAHLEMLHARLEENFERHDQEEYIRINNQYHSFIQEIAGNRTLNQIVAGLRKKILLYRFQSLNLPTRFADSIREHRDLLEAFRQRDFSRAEALMREHLKNQTMALKRLVEQSQAAT